MILYQNRDWLIQKYWGEELSCKKIAKLCGVCEETIRKEMKKLDISRRTTSEAGKISQNRPEVKKKMGENSTGKNNPMYGIHLFGEKNPFWGKKHTEETIMKMKAKKRGKIKKTCEQCGKEFEVYPSQPNRFCNKKCSSEFQKLSENNPNYRGGKIKRICEICGAIFEVNSCEVRKGAGKFCSRKCYAIWISQNYSGKNNHNWNSIKKLCPICGKEFYIIPSRIIKNGNTCSRNCCMKFRIKEGILKGKNNGRWLDGISFEPYGIEFNDELKAFVRERDNYQCQGQECGIKENGKAHDCHHIDYDKKNNEDWNLITLCKSCHTKTNSNRQYWQNYFEFQMSLKSIDISEKVSQFIEQ